jgi:hypothetical protein
VHPIAWILARKARNPLNPSHHQIWAIHCRLEPLNWPRSKRRPRGRRWTTSWSQKSAGAAVSHLGVVPCRVLPPKPRVIVPRRAREWTFGEPPMVPPHRAYRRSRRPVRREPLAQRWRARIRSPILFRFNKILPTQIKINDRDWSTIL